jgi:hypothetical protein
MKNALAVAMQAAFLAEGRKKIASMMQINDNDQTNSMNDYNRVGGEVESFLKNAVTEYQNLLSDDVKKSFQNFKVDIFRHDDTMTKHVEDMKKAVQMIYDKRKKEDDFSQAEEKELRDMILSIGQINTHKEKVSSISKETDRLKKLEGFMNDKHAYYELKANEAKQKK